MAHPLQNNAGIGVLWGRSHGGSNEMLYAS